jgi:Tat protein secretion system quality control protein TatD with DNase activity
MDKLSEPRMVKYVAEKIADLKGLDVDEVEAVTSLNAKRLFQLGANR